MIPEKARHWLREELGEELVDQQAVSGGCINKGARLRLSSGRTVFLKQNGSAPSDMFAAEFEGLLLLRDGAGPRVPEPYAYGQDFLITEDLAPAKPVSDWSAKLAEQLAQMHGRTAEHFGLERDNYLGSTPQINSPTEDGYEFFALQRLAFQTRLARDQGLLSLGEGRAIDQLAQRLPDLVPEQPAALLHGDLWSGNAISDSQGQPAIIDPAVHYGWAEAELGMTALFGGFGADFYATYEAHAHLEAGWRERLPLYNLYHLLNHLNLFGVSYHGQVMAVVRQFS